MTDREPRRFAHVRLDASLWAVILWGRLTSAETARLVASHAIELGATIDPHASIVDARRVETVEQRAFELLGTYVVDHHAELATKVHKLAMIRPQGMSGALVAGFFDVVPAFCSLGVFASFGAACRWLEIANPAAVERSLEAAYTERSAEPQLLTAVRAAIRSDLVLANIDSVCNSLSLSQRTLERRLREHGTTFKAEVGAARLHAAKHRLIDSEDPVTLIALDVGFATPQHFSTLFRRAIGKSPSAWRTENKQRRASGC
jgi:AraC-like DNA-binding protein